MTQIFCCPFFTDQTFEETYGFQIELQGPNDKELELEFINHSAVVKYLKVWKDEKGETVYEEGQLPFEDSLKICELFTWVKGD